MEQKMPKCGFGCRKTSEGQSDFDKFYIDRELKEVAVKTGEGEEDFVIQVKEVETKRNISDYINSQSSEVGIDAYIRRCQIAGGEVPACNVSEDVSDFVGAPEDLADLAALGDKAQEQFKKLDPALTGGLSMEDFLATLTKDKLDAYFASKIKAVADDTAKGDEK